MAASSFSQNTKCDCSKLKSRSCVHAIMKRKKPKTDDLRGLSAFVFIGNKLDPFEKSFHKLIRVSKHSKIIKALGLRPRAFISFLAFGNRGETLALVYGILHQKTSTRNQINLISLSSSLCKHICYVAFNLFLLNTFLQDMTTLISTVKPWECGKMLAKYNGAGNSSLPRQLKLDLVETTPPAKVYFNILLYYLQLNIWNSRKTI